MGLTLLTPPETESEFDVSRPNLPAGLAPQWSEIKEEGVFTSLVSSVRDAFFPEKLPPLELRSKPIPVVDRMAFKRSPTSTAIAVVLHAVVIGLIAWLLYKGVKMAAPQVAHVITPLDLPVTPPKAPPKAQAMGGGGGSKGPTPVVKGHLPKFEPQPIVPPLPPPPQQPKIAVEPSINVQKDLKMATNNLPNIGVPNSPVVGPMSGGGGSGGGLGSGNGNGLGPGSGGNTGGGVYKIGGGVSAPVVIFSVEPEFSEEARKAKVAGNVLVSIIVDASGHPQHVRVIRGIGMGLDEKAVEAVRQYRFKPAMMNGKPVAVEVNFDVNFQIF